MPENASDTSYPLIAIGALGGTIAMTPSAPGDAITPTLNADDLVAAVPSLSGLARIEAETLRNLPSPSLSLDDVLSALRWADAQVRGGAAGVVLTQGTDTLEETAFLAELLWPHAEPIVVTGAMRAPQEPGSEGPANLLAAVTVAADERARGLGALVVMNDEVHLADRVAKTDTMSVGAFTSPGGAPIGRVFEDVLVMDLLPADPRPAPLPWPVDAVGPRVALVESHMGDDGALVRLAVDNGYDGVVIAGMGAGHVPACAVETVAAAAARVPVVVGSRTGSGRTATRTYGYAGSETDLAKRGIVLAAALSPRKARLLLWLLVGMGADRARIAEEFALRGRRSERT